MASDYADPGRLIPGRKEDPHMKNMTCREIPVDANHNVMILFRDNVYDCYIMHHDENGSTPYFYMFGLIRNQPCADNMSMSDVIESAVVNAPGYYFLCDCNNEMMRR